MSFAKGSRKLLFNQYRLFSTIVSYKGIEPNISPNAFIASSASIIGKVKIELDASIWFNCVLRGDVANIYIGKGSNIQDGSIVHCNSSKDHLDIPEMDCIVGDNCTIGHNVILHACTLHDRAFIGMQSCIMDGVVIESDAMVAAGSLVTINKTIKSGELWGGRPAKFMRKLNEMEIEEIMLMSQRYAEWSKDYM